MVGEIIPEWWATSSGISSLLSGLLWLYATLIRIPTGKQGSAWGTLVGVEYVAAALKKQTFWNACAAGATGVAALRAHRAGVVLSPSQNWPSSARLALPRGNGEPPVKADKTSTNQLARLANATTGNYHRSIAQRPSIGRDLPSTPAARECSCVGTAAVILFCRAF